ncbi:hypothetical protein AB0877_24765 [Micromonospora sp. NPDC047644]|uniref:hypothetical protein n=1 Tax=Micromonospora sp. NPDC047644 TaxID=3157203 RepID=UPI003455DA52
MGDDEAVPDAPVISAEDSQKADPVARLFAKWGLVVRAGTVVDLRVAPGWQGKARIGWGGTGTPAAAVTAGCRDANLLINGDRGGKAVVEFFFRSSRPCERPVGRAGPSLNQSGRSRGDFPSRPILFLDPVAIWSAEESSGCRAWPSRVGCLGGGWATLAGAGATDEVTSPAGRLVLIDVTAEPTEGEVVRGTVDLTKGQAIPFRVMARCLDAWRA